MARVPKQNSRENHSTVADMFDLRQDIDNLKQYDNTIDHWMFDKEIYKDMYQRSQVIKDNVQKGEQILRPYPDLAEDMFYSLYKHRPMIRDEEEVTASHLFNRKLIEEMMQSDDYARLRQNTRFDSIASALGSEIIHDQLYQKIEQARNEYLARKQAAEDAGQQFTEEDIFDLVNQMHAQEQIIQNGTQQLGGGMGGGGSKKGKNLSPSQKAQLQQQIQQAQAQAKALQQQVQQAVQKQGNPMSNIIQSSMKQAADEVGETFDMIGNWGMGGGDPNIRVTYEDKKYALKRLRASQKLKLFAQLIGRFRKLAIQEQKRRVPDGKAMIKDVVVGNDLGKVLPSELLLLANPATEAIFFQKYLEKQLLQYEKDAIDNIGKGPIIALIDTSGSMSGQKEQWSKALALALLEVAQKQKRNFACAHFDDGVPHSWKIPYGQLKPKDVFDIAEKFSNGGTTFQPVLQWSLDVIKEDKFNKADIVFITDGDGYIDPNFVAELLKVKREKQFKVRTVLIDCGGDAAKHSVSTFSDTVMNISDMANLNDSAASNIFAQVQP